MLKNDEKHLLKTNLAVTKLKGYLCEVFAFIFISVEMFITAKG